jgi:hypothetical protein
MGAYRTLGHARHPPAAVCPGSRDGSRCVCARPCSSDAQVVEATSDRRVMAAAAFRATRPARSHERSAPRSARAPSHPAPGAPSFPARLRVSVAIETSSATRMQGGLLAAGSAGRSSSCSRASILVRGLPNRVSIPFLVVHTCSAFSRLRPPGRRSGGSHGDAHAATNSRAGQRGREGRCPPAPSSGSTAPRAAASFGPMTGSPRLRPCLGRGRGRAEARLHPPSRPALFAPSTAFGAEPRPRRRMRPGAATVSPLFPPGAVQVGPKLTRSTWRVLPSTAMAPLLEGPAG